MNDLLYEHLVLLEETNAVGGVVYFSNYVKWQGLAREYLLCQHFDFKKLLSSHIEMTTHSCSVRFLEHLYFGDTVQIRVTTRDVRKSSFVMVFHYFKKATSKLVAIGEQKLAFIDSRTKELCAVPEPIFTLAKSVETPTELLDEKKPQ